MTDHVLLERRLHFHNLKVLFQALIYENEGAVDIGTVLESKERILVIETYSALDEYPKDRILVYPSHPTQQFCQAESLKRNRSFFAYTDRLVYYTILDQLQCVALSISKEI